MHSSKGERTSARFKFFNYSDFVMELKMVRCCVSSAISASSRGLGKKSTKLLSIRKHGSEKDCFIRKYGFHVFSQ